LRDQVLVIEQSKNYGGV